MHVVHGAWIPEAEEKYQRGGAFYLWVEGLSGRTGKDSNVHPRALKAAQLADFLKQELGLKSYDDKQFQRLLKDCFLTLPTADGGPVKCYELLRYTGEDPPDGFTFQPWQVCAYPVPTRDLLGFLTDLHVLFAGRPSTVMPGNDLHFWYLFSQIVKTIVLKDQYIPAIHYQEFAASKKSKDAHYKLHPTWEIISAQYEARVKEYADLMPPICAAATQMADASATLFSREALLRHFTENLLDSLIHNARMSTQFDKQIAETLLDHCLHPSGTWQRKLPELSLKTYNNWAAWRNGLVAQHVAMPFHLGFQLQDAQTESDPWLLHFIIAAKDDPSLRLTLNDYWYLDAKTRKQVQNVFGKDADKHILLSLGQAARMYPKIWDGLETDKPTAVTLDMDETLSFLKEFAWILEDAGFKVIIPSWWTPHGMRRAKLRVKTSVKGQKKTSAAASTGLLNLDTLIQYRYDLAIGGEAVSPAEWQQLVNAKAPLVKFRGAWMELDAAKMQAMFEFWERQADQPQETTMLDFLAMAADEELDFQHDADIQAILARLQEPGQFELLPDPPKFQGKLRDYQKRGVSWLAYLEGLGLNGCLADDMGLGKTIQVIARLIQEREDNPEVHPTLLIAPTSVLGNWKKELERFAPHLTAMIHHGSKRLSKEADFQAECGKHDLVISSYALARRDEKLLQAVDWQRIVLDEAQNIKNPQAAQTKAILKLKARHRLTLTGTPVENRLLDLWSLFNFLNHDYLGTQTHFRKTFESPIQRENDRQKTQMLKKLTTPFILRRVKTDPDIIKDLPDKVEQKVYCNLSTEQASLYEAVVKDVAEQIERKEGMERKGLMLATLMKLKQICNHPAQFLQDGSAFTPERSQKLNRLQDMLEEVMENNESLLIFSQFREICSSLSAFTSKTLHYPTYLLHGGVSRVKRQQMIEAFQDPESDPAIFILSLKAGGVGLNLTKANHVFHFDRWWNPAVENQATDRAFRIGQTKNVFVHKFIALGTLEEKIDQMIEDKRQLADSIVGADEAWLTELDNEAFKELIALNRSAVLE